MNISILENWIELDIIKYLMMATILLGIVLSVKRLIVRR